MRRFFMLAAIWVGLMGPVDPLFACVMQAQVSDCCPTGAHDGGHHESNPCDGFTPAHQCHAPLAGSLDGVVVPVRKADVVFPVDLFGGSGGVGIVPTAFPIPARPPPLILAAAVASQSTASSPGTDTYLRTARLRL